MTSTEKGRCVKRKPLERSLKAKVTTVALMTFTTLSLAPGKTTKVKSNLALCTRIVSNSRTWTDCTTCTHVRAYRRAESFIGWCNDPSN